MCSPLVLVYFMVSNTQPCEATHRQGFESCFCLIQKVNFHCPLISQVIRSYPATQFLRPVRLFKSSNSPYESVWKGGNVHLDLGNDKPQAVLGSNSDPGGTCLCGILSKWPCYSRVQCPDLRNGSANNDYPHRVAVKTQWDNSCPVKAWHCA